MTPAVEGPDEGEILWSTETSPLIEVRTVLARKPDGSTYRHHAIDVQRGRGGVVIVPISSHGVAFVRIFRPLLGEVLVELPRGFREAADAKADAVRELAEEAGLGCRSAIDLGPVILDTGLVPTSISVVVVHVGGQPTFPRDDETMEILWSPDVTKWVREGTVRDAISLMALEKARSLGHLPS